MSRPHPRNTMIHDCQASVPDIKPKAAAPHVLAPGLPQAQRLVHSPISKHKHNTTRPYRPLSTILLLSIWHVDYPVDETWPITPVYVVIPVKLRPPFLTLSCLPKKQVRTSLIPAQ